MRFLFSIFIAIIGVIVFQTAIRTILSIEIVDSIYQFARAVYFSILKGLGFSEEGAFQIYKIWNVISNILWLYVGYKIWNYTRKFSDNTFDAASLYRATSIGRFFQFLFWHFLFCQIPLIIGISSFIWKNLAQGAPAYWFIELAYQHKLDISSAMLGMFLFNIWFIGPIGYFLSPWFARFIEFLDKGRFGRGGSGRLAGYFEEMAARYRGKTALYWGNSLFAPWVRIGPSNDRHMLTFGGSRGGKGTCCIIPNLLLWRGSALVIDPKGTNANVTARYRRRKLRQNVRIIDPFSVTGTETDAFNPLVLIDKTSSDAVDQINSLAVSLIPDEKDEKSQHFVRNARIIISGFIAQLLTDTHDQSPNLRDLFDYLTLPTEEKIDLFIRMEENNNFGGLSKITADKFGRASQSGELNSNISTIEGHLSWITSTNLGRAVDNHTFQFSDMKLKPTTIYIVIPPDEIDNAKGLMRLLTNEGINKFYKGGKSKIPTLFMIDEAFSIGYLSAIARGYSIGAEYNMFLWTFWQDRGQLKSVYGDQSETFISSSRATQYFSVADDTSAEFAMGQLGQRSHGRAEGVRSVTESMNVREATDLAQEVAQDSGLMYVFRTGKPPFLLKRVEYFRAFWFKIRADIDPNFPRRRSIIEAIMKDLFNV